MTGERNNLSSAFEKSEKLKYLNAWDFSNRAYADYSPGLELSNSLNFLDLFKHNGVRTILDAGCGSGKLLKKMLDMGFQCKGIDIADNCLDPELKPLQEKILKTAPLWRKETFEERQFDAVICTDVLEHIHPQYVEEVLQNIYHWANKYVFLQIALFEDYFGQKIKQRLHLTVRPKKWWDGQLQKFEYKVLACSKNDKGEECYAIYLLEKINRADRLSLSDKQLVMTEKQNRTHLSNMTK
ncbi:MAG: class I SAM-dependent methyltransferase [Phycisphaerales bacterium]